MPSPQSLPSYLAHCSICSKGQAVRLTDVIPFTGHWRPGVATGGGSAGRRRRCGDGGTGTARAVGRPRPGRWPARGAWAGRPVGAGERGATDRTQNRVGHVDLLQQLLVMLMPVGLICVLHPILDRRTGREGLGTLTAQNVRMRFSSERSWDFASGSPCRPAMHCGYPNARHLASGNSNRPATLTAPTIALTMIKRASDANSG
jgi:hypothetical protein